jgi:macrolide-specific efflux system membrane fusion protein
VAKADSALYVPSTAVHTAGGQSTVTVMQGGKQVARTVQTGITGDQGVEIKSGLTAGEQVVLTTSSSSSGSGSSSGFPGGGPGAGLGGAVGGGGRP